MSIKISKLSSFTKVGECTKNENTLEILDENSQDVLFKTTFMICQVSVKLKAPKNLQNAQKHAWGPNIKHICFLKIMRA